ncbi:MAG: nucleoside recognition domain-containing protein [Pseudomonadota bacterium]|nr:nucleoside recognition domain-containing protein [Pseudomonadota bacterium]
MNGIFFALVLISFLVAGWRQVTWVPPLAGGTSPMQVLAGGMIETAGSSVTLAIGLIGVMALFLGLMKVAEEGGMLTIIAKTIRPLMVRLFPEVPANHPAMGAMILNMSANALGLGNAATPFGIRAMQELDKLNSDKGTATNAMALFLAINTSSVTLLPTGVIAIRAAAGSSDPAGTLPTTLFATVCSTTVAILVCLLLQRRWHAPSSTGFSDVKDHLSQPRDIVVGDMENLSQAGSDSYPGWMSVIVLAGIAALVPLTIIYGRIISPWIIPGLMVGLLGFGMIRKVRIYEAFVEGAKDGFNVAVKIIPYLVAILVAVGMFRASGALEVFIEGIGPITSIVGMPPEAMPMALLRPLSGSGAYGVLASIIQDPSIGPDSYVGYLVSTLQGSTETTFYVLAVYFGAVQIRRIRHALVAALCADAAGIAAAVFICSFLYKGL